MPIFEAYYFWLKNILEFLKNTTDSFKLPQPYKGTENLGLSGIPKSTLL